MAFSIRGAWNQTQCWRRCQHQWSEQPFLTSRALEQQTTTSITGLSRAAAEVISAPNKSSIIVIWYRLFSQWRQYYHCEDVTNLVHCTAARLLGVIPFGHVPCLAQEWTVGSERKHMHVSQLQRRYTQSFDCHTVRQGLNNIVKDKLSRHWSLTRLKIYSLPRLGSLRAIKYEPCCFIIDIRLSCHLIVKAPWEYCKQTPTGSLYHETFSILTLSAHEFAAFKLSSVCPSVFLLSLYALFLTSVPAPALVWPNDLIICNDLGH